MRFICVKCRALTESEELNVNCRKCSSAVIPAPQRVEPGWKEELDSLPQGVWRYRRFLPQVGAEDIVTLGEGGTPLLPATRLGGVLGYGDLRIKDETRNPTGSFLDRGATVLISLAKKRRIEKLECVTTGNFGASIAAYSAKAGIAADVKLHPNFDTGKLYQMIAYGASVEILSAAEPGRPRGGRSLRVTAANPYLLEGEKTTGFEVLHELGWRAPGFILLPIGTGGHLTMVWEAIKEIRRAHYLTRNACRLVGVRIASGGPAEKAASFQTELEESTPLFHRTALKAIRESGGFTVEVSTKESVTAMGELARLEGIFAEPAAASVVAALKKLGARGPLDPGSMVVAVVTGTGLKDSRGVARIARTRSHVVVRERQVLRPAALGRTKLRILKELSTRPAFGYGIWKTLRGTGKITIPSVYQHLAELEGAGLIRRSTPATVHGRERVFYEISSKGREASKFSRTSQVDKFVID